MREVVILKCDEESCGRSHYHSSKNKKNTTEKLKLKKYCSSCRRHTYHLESK